MFPWTKLMERRRRRKEWQAEISEPYEWSLSQSILLAEDCGDDAVLEFAIAWLEAMARGEWASALTRLLPSVGWSPSKLENIVSNYGFLQFPDDQSKRYRVTAPLPSSSLAVMQLSPDSEEATGSVHPQMPIAVSWFLERQTPDHIGSLTTSIPLDGKWSDLSADFELLLVEPGRFGCRLSRLDVA